MSLVILILISAPVVFWIVLIIGLVPHEVARGERVLQERKRGLKGKDKQWILTSSTGKTLRS